MRFGIILVLTSVILLGAGPATAAAEETVAPSPEDQRPAAADPQAEGRACEGCPPRRVGMSLLQSKALAVVIGGGWEFDLKGRVGFQLFAMQHVGALGDLQTVNGAISDVTSNFWSLGAAIVIR